MLASVLIAGLAAAAPAQPKLRVVGFAMPTTPPNVVHIPPWVAQDAGIFARHGIEARILTFEAGPTALRALIGGGNEIQIAAPGVPPFVALLARGADLKAIYTYSVKHPVAMVVQDDIKRCQDLRGKKIGTPGGVGAYPEVMTRAVLQSCGLTPRDVQYVSIATGARVAALSTRQIDAIVLHLDQLNEVIKQKRSLHVLANLAAVVPNGWYAAYVTTGAFIRSDPKLVEDVVQSLVEADRFIYQNREKTIAIAIKYTKFDRDIVEKTYDQLAALGVWPVNDGLRKDLVDAGLESEVKIGDIPEDIKPTYTQAVQLGFINAAMTRLGRWTGDPRWY
jgi:ABC-type nitrate/sulfonate/bicarbonate transport system substrate-binding protein